VLFEAAAATSGIALVMVERSRGGMGRTSFEEFKGVVVLMATMKTLPGPVPTKYTPPPGAAAFFPSTPSDGGCAATSTPSPERVCASRASFTLVLFCRKRIV